MSRVSNTNENLDTGVVFLHSFSFNHFHSFSFIHFPYSISFIQIQGALLHKHHEREIINHRTVSGHPSIISFHELFLMDTHVVIVMEYATCGSLCSLLQHRRKLPEAEARRLFWQLLRGLQHCHSRDVFHRCSLSIATCLPACNQRLWHAERIFNCNAPDKMFDGAFLVFLPTRCNSFVMV